MFRNFQKVSSWLSSKASVFVIGIALLTFALPSAFAWVKGDIQTLILGLIMLTMGLTLSPHDFKVLLSRPLDILIGTMAQFTVMPFVAYGLTKLFNLDSSVALGIILVGCCPGGVSSNIMSFLCKGDVAFSVGMTTVSTLLAPVVTPFMVHFLAGEIVDVDTWGMFKNILIVTIIPVSIGFLLNLFFSRSEFFGNVKSVMPGFGVICLACIVGGVISAVHGQIISRGLMLLVTTLAVVFCHNTLGYMLGYFIGVLFKFDIAKNRTISIEVGMQNAGLATNLSANFFLATNPLAVVPCAISCVWHSISGTLLAGLFMKYGRR